MFRLFNEIILFFTVIPFCVLTACQCPAKNAILKCDAPLCFSGDTTIIDISSYLKCGRYIVNDTLDLKGETLYLPENSIVVLNRGYIKNGAIVGNNTILKYKGVVFDRVQVKGTWIVSQINTSMFNDLSYKNSLKDVFALTNPNINNTVIINKGNYQVIATKPSDACIEIRDNTIVKLYGDIYLTPNGYPMYSIVRTIGDNIEIKGSGKIVGDKYTHLNDDGEWGMGVYIMGGDRIKIKGISIKDCWGDCVYITKNANNVRIDDCLLEQGRRQGISIISTQNTLIRNTTINNIKGALPGYGIDIEPNQGDTVSQVRIEGVTINGCRGGVLCKGQATGSYIGSVIVNNCTINNTDVCPLNFRITNHVKITDCNIISSPQRQNVIVTDVNSAIVDRIKINGSKIDIMNDKRVYVENNEK